MHTIHIHHIYTHYIHIYTFSLSLVYIIYSIFLHILHPSTRTCNTNIHKSSMGLIFCTFEEGEELKR